MLFSISAYLGLDAFAGPRLPQDGGCDQPAAGAAGGDLQCAGLLARGGDQPAEKLLNIDVPIAAGIAAIFHSEQLRGFDRARRRLFRFAVRADLLPAVRRLFQQKTYDRLAFDPGLQVVLSVVGHRAL